METELEEIELEKLGERPRLPSVDMKVNSSCKIYRLKKKNSTDVIGLLILNFSPKNPRRFRNYSFQQKIEKCTVDGHTSILY